MGRRLLFGCLWGAASYLAGALIGWLLTTMLSSNAHDKSVEALMTGAFYTGPLVALVGFVFAAALTKRSRPPVTDPDEEPESPEKA